MATKETRKAHYVGDPHAQQTACGRYAPIGGKRYLTTDEPDAVTCSRCRASINAAKRPAANVDRPLTVDDVAGNIIMQSIIIGNSTCKSTVAGFLWYCDTCGTHGNADSRDEARHVSEAHAEYVDPDECDLYVWEVEG